MSDTGRETRAFEAALGLLPEDEVLTPDEQREADRWVRLLAEIPPGAEVKPPERVKTAIDRRLGLEPSGGRGLLGSLQFWRAATGLSAATAAVLAVLLLGTPSPADPVAEERLFVVLLSPTSDTREPTPAVLRSRNGDARISIPDLAGTAPIDEPSAFDRQLWLIEEGRDPVSLGLLPDDEVAEIALGRNAAIEGGVTIAVSLEPSGGSPTGLPTGPILATGELKAL